LTTEASLTIAGLSKRLGGVDVLTNVTAHMVRGGVTAFVGPNGAGKTTLFNTLAGEEVPDKGEIKLEGRRINHLAPWEISRLGLGRLFQDVRVYSNLSVLHNVIVALLRPNDTRVLTSLWATDRCSRLAPRALELLDKVGVQGRLDRPASELSWGNQKLLAFARLLAGEFHYVLLDEPVGGVSPQIAKRLKEIIRGMARDDGITVGLIEHDIGFVADLAQSIVLMKEGRVLKQGNANSMLQDPKFAEICFGL
jgi:ABC-type branched-subunit amino acid transport system ATPase component